MESSPLSGQVVDGVAGYPNHGREGHDEADDVSPQRIFNVAVLDRSPTEQVEAKDELEKNKELHIFNQKHCLVLTKTIHCISVNFLVVAMSYHP